MASFRTHRWISPLCLLIVLALCASVNAVEFAGGTGEPNNPYQIATAEQLIGIGSDPNLLDKQFALVADIDLDPNLPGGRVFNQAVIGGNTAGFSGSFDGRDKTIANLHMVGVASSRGGSAGHYLALFRTILPQGCVCNLNLRNVRVEAPGRGAALAVENQGTVVNCRVQGTVNRAGLVAVNKGLVAYCHADVTVTGTEELGGLIGSHEKGLVTHCSARAEITGNSVVGGLIGYSRGQVTDCYAIADITTATAQVTPASLGVRALSADLALGRDIGGLIGYWALGLSSSSELRDCYAVGRITAGPGSDCIGGLVGRDDWYHLAIHCYAAVRIDIDQAGREVGGLAGSSSRNSWQSCFFLDPNDGGGPDNKLGTPLTDAQMRQRDSFAGWDFFSSSSDGSDDPWFMPEGSYPILTCQTEQTGLTHVSSLRGIEMNQALIVIQSVGLSVGEIKEDCDTEIGPGRVLEVKPRGVLLPGTAVQIVVSTGPYLWDENPGDGTASDPYQVQTYGQFLDIGRHPELYGKCFVLMCDIDLGDLVFQRAPIAPSISVWPYYEFKGTLFSGHFDGATHTVSNLTILPQDEPIYISSHLGLFGCVTASGKISRLRVENARIIQSGGLMHVGLLCGENQGEISDCSAGGQVSYGNYTSGIGGLIGTNRGFVARNTAQATLFFVHPTAVQSVSVAALRLNSVDVFRSDSSCQAAPKDLGVLVGANYGVITDCHANGSVTGWECSMYMGGIAGICIGDGIVSNCYCAATAHGRTTSVGNVSGRGAVMNGYYLRDPSLPDPSEGCGVGLTDLQMRQQASFIGFDFAARTDDGTADVWTICEGKDYPRLPWENIDCNDLASGM